VYTSFELRYPGSSSPCIPTRILGRFALQFPGMLCFETLVGTFQVLEDDGADFFGLLNIQRRDLV
jgi:hypothetical protein